MKKLLKKLKEATWIQIIVTAVIVFCFTVSASNALSLVRGTEMENVVEISGDFEESGAFGNWEEFSDFYEESYYAVPDTPSRPAVSEEIAVSETGEEIPGTSEVSEPLTEISEPGIVITPGVSFESVESGISPEISVETEASEEIIAPAPEISEPPSTDSPINAPSITTPGFETSVAE